MAASPAEENEFAPIVRRWLRDHLDEVRRVVAEEFLGLGFYVEEVDGDVENVSVERVEFRRALLIDVEDDHATFTLQALVEFEVDVDYKDPDSGFWDSEDQVVLFQDSVSAVFRLEHLADVELLLSFDAEELARGEEPLLFEAFEMDVSVGGGRDVPISVYDEHEIVGRKSWHDDAPWDEDDWADEESSDENEDEVHK